MTQCMLTCPVTLTAGNYFSLIFTDATTYTVALAAGTYYPDGSGSADDLLAVMKTAFDSADADSGTWTITTQVTAHMGGEAGALLGRTIFSRAGGTKTVDVIRALDTDGWNAKDAGFDVSDGTGVADTPPTGAWSDPHATQYQRGGIWLPRDITLVDDTDIRREVVVSTTPSGAGIVDDYGGLVTRRLVIGPAVPAVCIKQQYADDAGYISAVEDLKVKDPNVSLESWLAVLRRSLSGTIPTLRYAPDAAAPGTYTSVRLISADHYRSIEAWVGEPTTMAPLQYGVTVDLVEV